MEPRIKKILKTALGWTCLIIGILGLFLPFIQGIALILIGLTLLKFDFLKKEMRIMREKILELKKKK